MFNILNNQFFFTSDECKINSAKFANATCIYILAHNEDNYMHEWITYHNNVGADYIFLMCDKGWDFDTSKYDNVIKFNSIVEIGKDTTCKLQIVMQQIFLQWCTALGVKYFTAIDTDEFITFRGDLLECKNLREVFDSVITTDRITLPWVYFGNNGLTSVTDTYSVIDRFTRSEIGYHNVFKQIIDCTKLPNNVSYYDVHHLTDCVICLPYKQPYAAMAKVFTEALLPTDLYIAHFASKTYEEAKLRSTFYKAAALNDRFFASNFNDTENFDVKHVKEKYENSIS